MFRKPYCNSFITSSCSALETGLKPVSFDFILNIFLGGWAILLYILLDIRPQGAILNAVLFSNKAVGDGDSDLKTNYMYNMTKTEF